MSISDDLPPSDDSPPPKTLIQPIKDTLGKLENKNELSEYLDHLSAYHTHHLSDLTRALQEKLMLQGLDEDDLFHLHNFLAIEFENGFLNTANKELTEKRAVLLQKYL